jgi:hypothetical protein
MVSRTHPTAKRLLLVQIGWTAYMVSYEGRPTQLLGIQVIVSLIKSFSDWLLSM